MSSATGPSIATSGLVLDFDAANLKSFGPPTVEALVVAGGGAGGGRHAGGGGGGGTLYTSAYSVNPGVAHTVTVGAGGSGFALNSGYGGRGNNGGNSVFDTLTASGGGGGGGYADGLDTATGANGGSGGGGAYAAGLPGGNGSAGSGISGQGFGGGIGSQAWNGGGGGGAGGAGNNASGSIGGTGGPGRLFSISGTPTYYGGGGGGCGEGGPGTTNGGAGGVGGGGAGNSTYNPTVATTGTANTGGGGGGSRDASGAAGGSGIVVIRYPGRQKASGGTITNISGFTVHTFTSSGTFTPGANWADVSSSSNIGTLNNSPTYSSANGGSLTFDGVNKHISIPNNTALDSQAVTVDVWVKTNATTQNGFWFEKGSVNSQYALFQEGASIQWRLGPLGDLSTTTASYMNTTNWYNVVGTYISGDRRLYVNGVQVNSNTTTGTLSTNTSGMTIGCYGGGGYMYNGSISAVKVYNRALSATEVQQNFQALRSRYGI